jgi:flagellar FliL protein
MLMLIVTAALAGGASFAGAKFGSRAHAEPAHAAVAHAVAPPGPTIAVDPFLVTIPDGKGPPHVLKLTIAIELKPAGKEDELKAFVPRIRDTTLTYLRALTYEEAQSTGRFERLRVDLLERIDKLGVTMVEQVLVTDFVTQ